MKNRIIILFVTALFAVGMVACAGPREQEVGENTFQKVTIYHSNCNADGFDTVTVELEYLTPDKIWSELTAKGVIPSDVQILTFEQHEEGGRRIILNLSESFHTHIRSFGTAGEYLIIGSIVNTFLSVYQAEGINIIVEGQILESGHAEYSGYLGIFE